ncbi:hypothetical protein ACFL3C_00555 [Patescibacteria group bacterium]
MGREKKSALQTFYEDPAKLAEEAKSVLGESPEAERYFEQAIGQLIHLTQKKAESIKIHNQLVEALTELARTAKTLEELGTCVEAFCALNGMVEYEPTFEISPELAKMSQELEQPLSVNQVTVSSPPDLQLEVDGHECAFSINYLYFTVCINGQPWAHYYRGSI